MRESCCVVEQDCLAPANGNWGIRSKCFACGDYVCRNCSKVRTYLHFGRKRICNTCAIQHKLEPVDGQENVERKNQEST